MDRRAVGEAISRASLARFCLAGVGLSHRRRIGLRLLGASVGTRHAPALRAQGQLRITERAACFAYDARTNMQAEQPLRILWGEVEGRRGEEPPPGEWAVGVEEVGSSSQEHDHQVITA